MTLEIFGIKMGKESIIFKINGRWTSTAKEKMRKSALVQTKLGIRKGLFKKGHTSGMTGKNHSLETIKKIKESNINKKHIISKEVLDKMKENSKKSKLVTIINFKNNPMKDKDIAKKVSIKNKGKHHSLKTEFKKGDKFLKERIKTLREEGRLITPIKDTSIEVKMQNLLKELGIKFFTHQYMKDIEHGYQCDILIQEQPEISKKTVIECFGTYWHRPYPIGRDIDLIRINELRDKGYRVLVFWENEIRKIEVEELRSFFNRIEGKEELPLVT